MGLARTRRWLGVVCALLTLAGDLLAQTSDVSSKTAAEALFAEGRRLMHEGKLLEACPKFAESQKLDAGFGTLLNLGRCYAALGQTASAWVVYSEAASLAHANGQPDREAFARARVTELAGKVPKLRVSVSDDANGKLEVTIDDKPWSNGLRNVAAPIDPGPHRLVARASGFVSWTHTFEAKAAQDTEVSVPVLEPAPRSVETSRQTSAPRRSRPWAGQKTAAVVGVAATVAAAALGATFAVAAMSDYSASDPHCATDNRCDPVGLEQRERAFDKARMSTIAFAFAGTALAGSAVLWFTAPTRDVPARDGSQPVKRAAVEPAKGLVIGVRGRW